jgi:hypothetical protein
MLSKNSQDDSPAEYLNISRYDMLDDFCGAQLGSAAKLAERLKFGRLPR